mgnify:CR=1
MKLFQSRTIKSKLSDFFLGVSASYFIVMVVSPGFIGKNGLDLFFNFIYYFSLVIIYFISSIIILHF